MGQTVIPRECIKSLDPTDETFCDVSPAGEINCHHVALTHIKGCAKFEVKSKEKEKK